MPSGRPKFKIDYGKVEAMASVMATEQEIASFLGCHRDTLMRDKTFCDIYKKGLDEGKMSLRRTQFEIARKNSSMAIFLGKNYLGQKDNIDYIDNTNVNKQIIDIAKLINNPSKIRTEDDLNE